MPRYLREPISADHLRLDEDERYLVASSVRSDLVRLDIFLASSKQTVIRESPKYPSQFCYLFIPVKVSF